MFAAIRARKEKQEARMRAIEAGEPGAGEPCPGFCRRAAVTRILALACACTAAVGSKPSPCQGQPQRHSTDREGKGSPTLQTLQVPILLTPRLYFRGGGFPNPCLGGEQ